MTARSPHPGFIYFIGAPEGDVVKIGFSVAPEKRIRQIQSGNADDMAVLHQFRAPKSMEGYLHTVFKPSRVRGEWFTNAAEIRDFARRLEENHLALVLSRMGLAAWPQVDGAQREILARFDNTSITEHSVKRALADLWPEDAYRHWHMQRRRVPVVIGYSAPYPA